jgi:AraC family transcriptional regulator
VDTIGGIGQFIPWDGACLLIGGSVGIVPLHAHYAIQVAFGSVPGLRFRTSSSGDWTEYVGAVIQSRQPHAMDGTRMPHCAVLLVEPETNEGRALAERYGSAGITALGEDELRDVRSSLFAVWREGRDARTVQDAAMRVIRALTGGVQPAAVSDERILRAIAHIRAHLDTPLTLTEVAAVACLSPSRFRHLFVEQTGTALRPYILWRRFLRVWELLMAGESLSSAAHSAGFADAAHLSRTSKRAFGFPPSAMRVSSRTNPLDT